MLPAVRVLVTTVGRVESMSEEDNPSDRPSAVSAIDYDILKRIGSRLQKSERFSTVTLRPEYAPDSLVTDYDTGSYPATVDRAYLRIRWYENDDFNIHYSEQYRARADWDCRWDRHPNGHNTREHFHTPPDAAKPGEDETYPDDWRDVVSRVLHVLDERIRAFWV